MVFKGVQNLLERAEEHAFRYEPKLRSYFERPLPAYVQAMKPRPAPTSSDMYGYIPSPVQSPPPYYASPPPDQYAGSCLQAPYGQSAPLAQYAGQYQHQSQEYTPPLPPRLPSQRRQMQILTDQDIRFFMAHGYVKVSGCFTSYQCSLLMGDLWQRMGISPDKRTWYKERFDVEGREDVDFNLKESAPKAWAAICDLLGGEERLEEGSEYWDDSFIVNLGTPQGEGKYIEPDGWHVDGDFFSHFLDSPEQGLLVLPLFTDVRPGGGATAICPAALTEIARYLYEHPEGVSPDLIPRAEDPFWNRQPTRWPLGDIVERMGPRSFIEATGNAGDVFFLHPLMAHSASNNMLRELRVINNPNVQLKQPFCFDRNPIIPFQSEWGPNGNPTGGEYSLVELTTMNFLRRDNLRGWRITGTRDKITPEQRKWEKEEELRRLNESKPKTTHLIGGYLFS